MALEVKVLEPERLQMMPTKIVENVTEKDTTQTKVAVDGSSINSPKEEYCLKGFAR
ncbi:hypothetical protein J6590_094272 [Homalodisca vitripennis]|nr:hypothetical protein J6590_094272 [Homalodisca vitripennis]